MKLKSFLFVISAALGLLTVNSASAGGNLSDQPAYLCL
jgi:hypothetical protein